MPFWAFTGCLGVVAGITADGVHTLGSDIGIIDKAEDVSSMLTSALISSGVLYLALSTYDIRALEEVGIPTILALGAGGEITASFATNMLLK